MPINKYFSGHGDEVMSSMKKTYGSKKAKNVFYATVNKRKQKGLDTGPSHSAKKRLGV